MNLFSLLAFGLVVMVSAIDKEEAKEMFRNMSQECKEKEGAGDADVEMMINEKYPETNEGKCLMACMYEQFGVVSRKPVSVFEKLSQHEMFQVKEKKFSKEGFMSLAAMAAGDEKEKLKQAEEIADECKSVYHDDRCAQAIMIGKCMEEQVKKRDLKVE